MQPFKAISHLPLIDYRNALILNDSNRVYVLLRLRSIRLKDPKAETLDKVLPLYYPHYRPICIISARSMDLSYIDIELRFSTHSYSVCVCVCV